MEIQDLRLGNLIKISPRPNEEGILFLAEIHPLSIIGVMLEPRHGYHFRIKFEEMLPLEISSEWLQKFGFIKSDETNDIWIDRKNQLQIKFSGGGCQFINGDTEDVIAYAHELQNQYFNKTGDELVPKF